MPCSDDMAAENESVSTISSEIDVPNGVEVCQDEHSLKMKLLDLYSGCGAMSTGLCLGANSGGVKLVTVSLTFVQVIEKNSLRNKSL